MAKTLRFIHCADLHLGSPFQGLAPLEERWGRIVGNAPLKAFQKVVQLAIDKRVHALLIAGDIYDSATHNLTAQLDFVRLLHKLALHEIPVYIALGNHDPMTSWRAEIPFPANVHVFATDKAERLPLIVDGEEAAALYGQSYEHREFRENAAWNFRRREEDRYAIGLLHTQVGGNDSAYAPCTLNDLKESGMDYWALGHVHTRRILAESPYIVYPGNTQGLDSTETGPRGCYYVEVGPYGSVEMRFIDTSVARWETADISVDAIDSVSALRESVRIEKEKIRREAGKPVFLTVNFTGAGSMYRVINNPESVQYWINSWQEDEEGKYAFVMGVGIRNGARPKINLAERSKLPDTVGDYLNISDQIESQGQVEKLELLRRILTERPEFERLGAYGRAVSDERLLAAFERAKWLGMQQLLEDNRGQGS